MLHVNKCVRACVQARYKVQNSKTSERYEQVWPTRHTHSHNCFFVARMRSADAGGRSQSIILSVSTSQARCMCACCQAVHKGQPVRQTSEPQSMHTHLRLSSCPSHLMLTCSVTYGTLLGGRQAAAAEREGQSKSEKSHQSLRRTRTSPKTLAMYLLLSSTYSYSSPPVARLLCRLPRIFCALHAHFPIRARGKVPALVQDEISSSLQHISEDALNTRQQQKSMLVLPCWPCYSYSRRR